MRRVKDGALKMQLIIWSSIFVILFIVFSVLSSIYDKNLKKIEEAKIPEKTNIENLPMTNEVQAENEIKQASMDLGKDINQVEEETKVEENIIVEESQTSKKEKIVEPKPEKKELSFVYPVEGEIVKDFAKETLIFSETLQEWTTHNGIDIKAERTSVVKAAEDGKVIAIKNDPRYGLTVIVEHIDGFKTVYSNLLTSEFVTEQEEIKKGQSIGTVGNSAAFEIADKPHLHFEMLLNDENVDPKIYLK